MYTNLHLQQDYECFVNRLNHSTLSQTHLSLRQQAYLKMSSRFNGRERRMLANQPSYSRENLKVLDQILARAIKAKRDFYASEIKELQQQGFSEALAYAFKDRRQQTCQNAKVPEVLVT